ncbi:TraB/GumN family protein [Ravibacter arvi]|uniref:TraB/GumN family protein n=1 Tax=Ravibacter arvi TaxID=2051041 RepID=A0ABP8M1I8_9BACT
MRRKGFRLVFLFLLCFGPLFPAPASAQSGSLLWEVTGKGLQKPSYLFGTIHLICPGQFTADDSLRQALGQSDRLFLELDMTDPGLTEALMASMYMKNGTRLTDLLPEEAYNKTAGYFRDSVGFDIGLLAQAKPFLLTSILFNHILDCPIESVEGVLAEIAKEKGLYVNGLESPEEQAAVFDSIPYNVQAKMVVQLIDSIQEAKSEFMDLMALYHRQDIDAIFRYTQKSKFDFEGFEHVVLTDRNKKWLPKLDYIMQESPTFIAVGAAHLGGKNGLVALLRGFGYQVRPIIRPL